jgi:formate dehydrogenase subunit gamma
VPRPGQVRRFSRTERALHWVHAAAFLVMLGSGLVLYLPALSEWVGRRPTVKAVHLNTAIAWASALLLIVLVGDRRGLRRTLEEIERFDREDMRALGLRHARAGRFNVGQKLNAIATTAFSLLLALTGTLLWLGERDTRFRLAGTVFVHDALMWLSLMLLAGHLYLALLHPGTRHATHGMVLGTVREDWAQRHHPRWLARAVSSPLPPPPETRSAADQAATRPR